MSTPDIFLSYNREDAARAKLFADAFVAEGFEVWWDANLRSGEEYDRATEAALRSAKAVVVLWSKRSVDSSWVRAEATQAYRSKTLMPAMIEDCVRPVMFELTQTAELSQWRGDRKNPAWQAFVTDRAQACQQANQDRCCDTFRCRWGRRGSGQAHERAEAALRHFRRGNGKGGGRLAGSGNGFRGLVVASTNPCGGA